MQFHWDNAGYASFDDFLAALSSRKRKVIRRERRDANAAGLTFHALRGRDITERALGRVLPLLHLHRGPQMGQRLPDAAFLLAARRTAGRPSGADAGRECRQAGRGRAEPGGRRRAVRPQLGLPRRLAVSAFRALLLPRHRFRDRRMVCSASRPARRASTRSSAAICRNPPIPRTGSRIRACAARSLTRWTRSGRRSAPKWRRLQRARRFAMIANWSETPTARLAGPT